MYPVMVIVF